MLQRVYVCIHKVVGLLRMLAAALVILGTAPNFVTIILLVRVVTLLCPSAAYRRGEQLIYATYIAVFGFCFETWSGVKVCNTMHVILNYTWYRKMGY